MSGLELRDFLRVRSAAYEGCGWRDGKNSRSLVTDPETLATARGLAWARGGNGQTTGVV